VLRVHHLSLKRNDPFGMDLSDIGLTVRAGEVVGIAGVSGNGQGELLRALSGEDPRAPSGTVLMHVSPHTPAHIPTQARGKTHDIGACSPAHRRKLGLHFVPEERLGRGAVPLLSLAQNLLLTRSEAVAARTGWLNLSRLREQAQGIIERYQVKTAGPHAPAKSLSGGNLQKFIVGREIEAQPALLIVSQPTWGVDVGAAAQIRGNILALRDAGCAVLVVSEELDELFEMADRLHVMAKGRLSPSLSRAEATVERLGAWMSGLWEESDASPAGVATAVQNEVAHAQA
jgi:simple sugar transport system ATP-binding protein